MSLPLIEIQIGTSQDDAYAIINDNFNKVVQDVRDLGANLSTTATYTATVASGAVDSTLVALISMGTTTSYAVSVQTAKPESNVTGFAPQLDIYVDTDNDDTYLWPFGSSLTSNQRDMFPTIVPALIEYDDTLVTWVITLNNRDASTHTYYVHTRCGYFPTGPTGFFR